MKFSSKRSDNKSGDNKFSSRRKQDGNSERSSFSRKKSNRNSEENTFSNKRSDSKSVDKKLSKSTSSFQKKDNYKKADNPKFFRVRKIKEKSPDEGIRLNKFIANSGVCSRREADELIKTGVVLVNDKVITQMGFIVMPIDKVQFDGRTLTAEKPAYILLNKPKGYITSTQDEKMRKTVMDLVSDATPYRLYPVGRLDRPTTGLLLLTNDGFLTKKLTHPSHEVKKLYHVTLDKKITQDDLHLLVEKGVRLEEGVAKVDAISYIEGRPKNEVGVEIHIGWNRVIRRMFKRLGYEVEALDRVMFAGLTKKNLKRGFWRNLTEQEVNNLKML